MAVCGLNSLVEDRKVDPWITEARIRWRKILGTELYNKQQAAPTDTRFVDLMDDEKGWGKSYLCWTAYALSFPFLAAEADRGGVFQKEEQGKFQSVSTGTLAMLKNTAESSAEARERMLLQYLNDNASDYPEWATTTGSEDRIDERTSRNTAGVSFRRSRAQNQYRG